MCPISFLGMMGMMSFLGVMGCMQFALSEHDAGSAVHGARCAMDLTLHREVGDPVVGLLIAHHGKQQIAVISERRYAQDLTHVVPHMIGKHLRTEGPNVTAWE